MTDQLRVYFHYHSPYSRLALHILTRENITERIDFKLYTLSNSAGEDSPPAPVRTRARMMYILQDAARMTERLDLSITRPEVIAPDYIPAGQYFYGIETMPEKLAFATALSNLRWGQGKDISQADILESAVKESGVSTRPISTDAVKDHLRADQEMVEKDLAFGVPFAVLEKGGRKEPFFGQDRFDLLLERID